MLVAFFILAATAPAQETPPASVQFQNAYKLLSQADAKRDTRQLSDAINMYSDALNAYIDLANKYPNWQSSVVKFRITYCNEQVETLLKEVGSMSEPTPSDAEGTDKSTQEEIAQRVRQITDSAGALMKNGQHAKARVLLLDGLKLNPDDHDTRLLLGIAQCQAEKYNDAIYLLKELSTENPTDLKVNVALGTAYYAVGQTEEAKKELNKALSLNPSMKEAHYNMSQLLIDSDPPDLEQAIEHYKTALKLGSPQDKALEARLRLNQAGN